MTDHPQTATERFIVHAANGDGLDELLVMFAEDPCDDAEMLEFVRKVIGVYGVEYLLLQPRVWQAAGRSLGWDERFEYQEMDGVKSWRAEWQCRQLGLIEWLWSHPGDVEGYMASLLDDDPLPHQEPCNCRDCSLTDTKDSK